MATMHHDGKTRFDDGERCHCVRVFLGGVSLSPHNEHLLSAYCLLQARC